MPGIASLDIAQFRNKIAGFKQSYVDDWRLWVTSLEQSKKAATFGRILRKWQACRPNRMRRPRAEAVHAPPYLEELIEEADPFVKMLCKFDLRNADALGPSDRHALQELWAAFKKLSYHGRARGGAAGVVGISKATMLLTEGRVGPAFDSNVRAAIGISAAANANEWILHLGLIAKDIQAFEVANGCTLKVAAPDEFSCLPSARIYDMALGPRG